MKKKVNVKTVADSMDPSLYSVSVEDSRTRFRHECLKRDYEELEKETDVMRKKLEMMKQKRLILLAEVRFLKRRHELLTLKQTSAETQNSKIVRKPYSKKKKQTLKEAGLRSAVPSSDPNKKTRVYKEAIPGKKLIFEKGNEAFRTLLPLPDLNQKEKMINGNENTSSGCKLHIFDLNQISMEEDELQSNCEQITMEDDRKIEKPVNDGVLNEEVKLSICRNVKKGMNRGGKRKVSWQDPVALRV